MSAAEKPKRVLPPVTLEASYRLCRERAAPLRRAWGWSVQHLGRQERNHLDAVLALAVRCWALCDIRVDGKVRQERLDDLREDMRNNLMEEESTDQFPALLDTVRRFRIPLEYVHQIVAAPDLCLRIGRFESYDDWLLFGYRLGAGTLVSVLPLFRPERQGYEAAAVECGQAIGLAALLETAARDAELRDCFLRAEIFSDRLPVRNERKPGGATVSPADRIATLAGRIAELLAHGSRVVGWFGTDGQRTLNSVVAVWSDRLEEIRRHPEQLLVPEPPGVRTPPFRYRLRHWLGLERRIFDEGH